MATMGTPGNDLLTGTAANDLLQGFAGNDTLVGDAGIDLALYAGTKAGYRVQALGAGRWALSDIDATDGDEGVDQLTGIEKLRFTDGDLQLDDRGEFQVNTWTRDHQGDVAIAGFAGGGWLAAWMSYGQDGDRHGVYAQRHAASGQPLGPEFRINETTAGDQREVAVATLADGGFVAIWSSGVAGVALDLVGRRFAADGTPAGAEFSVDASPGYEASPAVLVLPDGGLRVVWTSTIFGLSHLVTREFSPDGVPRTDAAQIDDAYPPTSYVPGGASIAPLGTGAGFVVVWQAQDGDRPPVLRALAADGTPLGPEVLLGDGNADLSGAPGITRLADGHLVATWYGRGGAGSGDADGAIYVRTLSPAGEPRGQPQQLNARGLNLYGDPCVAAVAGGGFVVVWVGVASSADPYDIDIVGRRCAADGSPLGDAFRVNTASAGQQWRPVVTGLADGGFVVAWRTDGLDSAIAGDYGTGGIFAQRYNAAGEPMPAHPPAADVGTAIEDMLFGGEGSDTLTGLAGNDTLAGLGGNDLLDGGAGSDEARLAGSMADHVFSNTVAYRFGVSDTNAADGDNGSDTLVDVERIAFADGAVTLAQRSEFVLAAAGTAAQWVGASDISFARLADGRLVAAWTGNDGSRSGVFAQLLAADATPAANVFRVNTTTLNAQASPSVAALADGGFAITWDSEQDGSESGVYVRRYTAGGVELGGEMQVNTTTRSDQILPQMVVLPAGGFLVAWSSLDQDGSDYGVYGQRLAADGTRVGGEFRVSQTTVGSQWLGGLVLLDDGSQLVTWTSVVPGGSSHDSDVYARRYAADGSALSGEIRVNTYTTLDQGFPSAAALAGGGFVIVWHSQDQDGSGYGVFGQRFAAGGVPVGVEFRVNTTTDEPQSAPTVAALPDGGFLVVWSSGYYWIGPVREYHTDLYGQRFAADGTALGTEFRVNSFGDRDQGDAAIVALAGGGLLVAWESPNPADGEPALMAKIFNADGSERNELTVSGGVAADTLRGGEGTQILAGGAGDDVYEADLAHDRIVEAPGQGRDTLRSFVSTALPQEVEVLRLLGDAPVDGSGNAQANQIIGNTGPNRLWGLGGDDTLEGGGGDDTLLGGAGNDTLGGGAGRDVFEFAPAGDGIDLLVDFGDGDRMRVVSAALAGPITSGNGAGLAAGQVQLEGAAGQTLVSIGLDAIAGADLQLRLAGVFGAADLHAAHETIRFNHAPTVVLPPPAAQWREGTLESLRLDTVFGDADAWAGDRLTLSARLAGGLALPPWLAFDAASGRLSALPGNDDAGFWRIELSASDLALATTGTTLALTVADVNVAPRRVAPMPDLEVAAGMPLQFTPTSLQFVDVDRGDRLAYSLTLASGATLPPWLGFDAASGVLLGTPPASDVGRFSLRVTATDRAQSSVQDDFDLAVQPWALALAAGDALTAYALEHVLTGSAPAPGSQGRWMAAFANGGSAEQVGTQLLHALAPALAPGDLIDRLYLHVLDRPPTTEERAGLLEALGAGALTPGALLAIAASLPEHLARIQAEVANGIQWMPWNASVLAFGAQGPAAEAFALHHALNGAAPAPEVLGRWSATLAHDDANGVAAQMLAADATGIGDAALVARLFANVVGRPPTPQEAAPFEAMLTSGSLTQAQLLVLAADTAANHASIDAEVAAGMAIATWGGSLRSTDVQGTPGLVYALLYALFDAPPAAEVVGRWLAYADSIGAGAGHATAGSNAPEAMTETTLSAALLDHFHPGITNAALVDLLYTNLFGPPADRAAEAGFQALLDDGSLSQASLLLIAAESELNLNQYIGLIGLGIEYDAWLGA